MSRITTTQILEYALRDTPLPGGEYVEIAPGITRTPAGDYLFSPAFIIQLAGMGQLVSAGAMTSLMRVAVQTALDADGVPRLRERATVTELREVA